MGPRLSTHTPWASVSPLPRLAGIWGCPSSQGGETCQTAQRLLQRKVTPDPWGHVPAGVRAPRDQTGLGRSDLQRWGGEGRTGPEGPSPPQAASSPPQPPPSTWSFGLEGTRPMMRSPHPKQVPGPAWGSVRELGAKWAALAISSPPAGLGGYILVGSRTRHRLPAPSPKPASQGCSLGHLFQGPSQCWSSHEAPRGQDVPRSDREAERLPCPPPGLEQGPLACFSHQETLILT